MDSSPVAVPSHPDFPDPSASRADPSSSDAAGRFPECDHPFTFAHFHGDLPRILYMGGGRLWAEYVANFRAVSPSREP